MSGLLFQLHFMPTIQPQDSRGFFMLPQSPEDGSYYTYGTPSYGAGQYSHASMITFLSRLEFWWGEIDNRKIGIGNISLAGGARYQDHQGHRSGLNVDIRPLRRDGKGLPVRHTDSDYDHQGTKKLIDLIWKTGMVRTVYFNDPLITNAKRLDRHDDHIHVDVKA